MIDRKSLLLGTTAGLITLAGSAAAADLPVKKAAPIEYVRVCGAYGAGFFYIPGTDTCLRISGRARMEAGYLQSGSRNGAGNGDTSQFRGLLRLNVDARTQTDYGTLRAFLRTEMASRTGDNRMTSGSQQRIGNAFPALGQDSFGRVQDYVAVDKAFVQFAGLTAGRASSFFDFYAHDFEIIGQSLGSDVFATNLLAYTQTFGGGLSATLSMEDPNFRKNPFYSQAASPAAGALGQTVSYTLTNAPSPVITSLAANGLPSSISYVDVVQRSRMPDFVGVVRYDAPWGSAQLSGAVKDINIGGPLAGTAAGTVNPTRLTGADVGAQTAYGWAVQGGLKVNLPQVAPGDSLYLQGAYGQGAAIYTGMVAYTGTYLSNATVFNGNAFNQFLSDAVLNPLTGRIETSNSFTATVSYLHYWSPEWRSAFYGSYGEMHFPRGLREAFGQISQAAGSVAAGGLGLPFVTSGLPVAANGAGFAYSQVLRDTSQIVAGASLIWSPVKDLDIGVEGQYMRAAILNGKVTNNDRTATIGTGANATPVYPINSQEAFQARVRVQRDF
ncbi:porin [Methylobacterium brachythecii]|uniref:Porin n=1 Tax=Methylobacterium brachythecii TaxID=1176177 RepID=A0A7W6ALH1_9HYPH|nr:porin [Methylobacterium brachythecii]MBB3905652.1 hypothetical protein [Methylobacterium brachythecii]GLS46908.1 polymerase [Methylobacterium brachythecii]